ncbi:molybdopterin-dependent oxidoreductase [Desulfosporosinus meridiei]|uniref:Anaerobic dehydrogenase, typically selenocysteine-containing n=1 Tax=Desulfosporosinus meridiei (strain ATCC BAA-275 / DSM 13257 / KCTC 12902 / NCIMB 13706 / S10) TaxID=768704 RepID=J7J0P3_DESMD|nr:molybdopterin-dependent oxidoreductase [Desulfosporosinus meridiei]AFQ45929.1 anaerobic dehydrogenase, typically selenocysteine-containing [Desulfosporosinus meridiei DSM 13257]
MANFIENAKKYSINRRSFLGWTATLTAGTAAALTLPGCGLAKVDAEKAAALAGKEGEWITAACWHNCGGRCLNKAYVVDGVVLRQKTDDTHPDSPDYPQQRGCARGRSQRQQVYGADRLKYPMKRKNWEPGTGGKRELRGRDEWVRISWDEALDSIAAELKRVKEAYGNKSILTKSPIPSINAFGGSMTYWGTTSDGAWPKPQQFMNGGRSRGSNDRLDLKNAKLIVLWGSNPAWSSAGNPAYNYKQAKDAGAKIIMVDPFYTDSAQILADEWIPVRPGTDTALLLGMAHYMITNNLHDQAFLDKYCVGFDQDHMPEGADPQENFKDYVLGTYDGQPKTPEWASEHCGTDPELIRTFAHQIAVTKPMTFSSSSAAARTMLGEQFCQAFLTVGWMTGNVGKPGASISSNNRHNTQSYGGPALVNPGKAGGSTVANPLYKEPTFPGPDPFKTNWHGIVWDEAWDAVVKGEYTAGVRGKQPCDIRALVNIGVGNPLNQATNLMRGIEAFRKVEFVVSSAHFLTTTAKYSDIVLPATTEWEKVGGFLTGNPEMLIYYSQVTEPLYETKDDNWIDLEIGKRLGFDPKKLDPLSEKQKVFNQLAGSTVIKEDGSGYEPLVTITAEDIAELGVDGTPQQGRIGYKEFKERGIYQVPRAPGDKYGYIDYKKFIDDPEKNPLGTESGKFQIHSQALADNIKAFGWSTLAPIAKYQYVTEGYEETFTDYEKQVKGDYPLQLTTIHYARRSHSTLDNIPGLREAFGNELYMNPSDAEARGIHKDDIVKITSRHGSVIRPLYLTERMMPGTLTLGQGAWAEIDEESGVCKAGAVNVLNGGLCGGQGTQGYNTCNVQVEKYNGSIKLKPDHTWPQRIVSAQGGAK